MIINIKHAQLEVFEKATEELKSKILLRAVNIGMWRTLPRISFFAKAQLNKSKYFNMKKDFMNKRTKFKRTEDSNDYRKIRGKIYFASFNEAYSSFPFKVRKIQGKNGRTYKGLFPTVLGKEMFSQGAFLRAAKRGDGSMLSLARKGKERDSKDKITSNVSISDVLRQDNSLLNRIVERTSYVYAKETTRAVYPGIQEYINGIKMGKKK